MALDRRPIVSPRLAFALWTFIALAFATSTYAMYALKNEPASLRTVFIPAALEWYLWAALAPFIIRFAQRVPFTRESWLTAALLHLPVWIAALVVHETALALLERVVMPPPYPRTLGRTILFYGTKRAALDLMVYTTLAGIAHAADLYRRYRERELRTSQLEAQLAKAQLHVLRSQLQPHFLFNTLNTISALMRRDVEAADRVVTRLGDLLRLSLQQSERHEVPLRQELEFLERYVEIQQTRFRDRLTVTLAAEPEALDALVPGLLLQPLVENAIRHGIEPRAAPGRVRVRAWRDDGRLVLEVADDGIGLAPQADRHGSSPGNGIGLANTRARLTQLYGADHRFTLADAEPSGVVVRLEIPFRLATTTPVPSRG